VLLYPRRFCRSRNIPAPARPVIAIHIEGGTGVPLGAAGATVIEKGADADTPADAFPLCASVLRRAADWLSGRVEVGSGSVGAEESKTLPVKLNTPTAVGVPVMAPVPVFRFSPDGSDPDEME
jgi:hypothetical protein